MDDNIVGGIVGGIAGISAAAKNRKAARDNEKKQYDLIRSLDWTPTTSAELAPTYQRSQSPVARSYLESFLLGNNPDSVMPGDPMAAQKKRQMQYSQNQMFGTPEQRVAQQNAYRATTPWAIDPQKVQGIQAQKDAARNQAAFTAATPEALGLDEKMFKRLQAEGVYDQHKPLSEQARKNQDVVRSLAEVGDYDSLKTLLQGYDASRGPSGAVRARRKRKEVERRAQGIVDRERARLRELEESE